MGRRRRSTSRLVEQSAIALEGLIRPDDITAGQAQRNISSFFASQTNGDLASRRQPGIPLNGSFVDRSRYCLK
jgi:hypothetical protein